MAMGFDSLITFVGNPGFLTIALCIQRFQLMLRSQMVDGKRDLGVDDVSFFTYM